jgi:hypothetical protein
VLDDVPHVERLQLALHARMEADAVDLRRSDA